MYPEKQHYHNKNQRPGKSDGQELHLCLIVVEEVEGAVQRAEGQVGGPVELHLPGQVAAGGGGGGGAAQPRQVVEGSRTAHQGPDDPLLVHLSDPLPVADEEAPVDRHGDALHKDFILGDIFEFSTFYYPLK